MVTSYLGQVYLNVTYWIPDETHSNENLRSSDSPVIEFQENLTPDIDRSHQELHFSHISLGLTRSRWGAMELQKSPKKLGIIVRTINVLTLSGLTLTLTRLCHIRENASRSAEEPLYILKDIVCYSLLHALHTIVHCFSSSIM